MKTLVSFPDKRNILYDSVSNTIVTNGELTGNILHIWDVVDDQTIDDICQAYGTPEYVFTDGMCQYESDLDITVYAVDTWLESELVIWEKEKLAAVDNVKTTQVANFQINKKQINRYLTIKFCEIFNLDVDYTWSGIGESFDLSCIVLEKTQLKDNDIDRYWSDILAPISKFNKKWIDTCNHHKFSYSVTNYGSNYTVWHAGLNNVMSNTAISLITESVWTQKAATFSEKTAFSVLALTFPIWVGGYNMASEWKKKGFDIFEDIIDHSYESMPTLLERCFYAFYLNLNILTNVNLAAELRSKYMDRLVKNRDMLTSENFKKYNRKIINTWPANLQQPALESIHRYLRLK
jgi:hypothetical protein